jgi:YfiH family protein
MSSTGKDSAPERPAFEELAREGLAFELPGGGRALFTTRAHGNMSSVGGLDHEHGLQARERLRTQLGLRRLTRTYQAHGRAICFVHGEAIESPSDLDFGQSPVKADGQVTHVRRVGVMALAADCLPVALGGAGGVAIVHAGWRGLAAGVLGEGVVMLRALGVESEIAAIVGPGAGPCCYDVGPEVHAAFAATPAAARAHLSAGESSPIDLRAIAHRQLHDKGVTDVRDVAACTICDTSFFSHRREAARAGRQTGIAWVT